MKTLNIQTKMSLEFIEVSLYSIARAESTRARKKRDFCRDDVNDDVNDERGRERLRLSPFLK